MCLLTPFATVMGAAIRLETFWEPVWYVAIIENHEGVIAPSPKRKGREFFPER